MSTIRFENGQTVNFEGTPTPQDIEEVAQHLGISKSAPAPTPQSNSFLPNLNQTDTLTNDVKDIASGALKGGTDIMERQLTGKQNVGSSLLQFGGLGAKVAGQLVFGVPAHIIEKAIPDAERKPLESIFSNGISAIANHPVVKSAIQKAQAFAVAHPEAAANIGAGTDIATTFGGAGVAKEVAPLAEDALKTGNEAFGNLAERAIGPVSDHFATKSAANEAEKALELTRPTLSKAEKEAAIASGAGKSGGIFSADTITPTTRDLERADVAHPFIAGVKDPNEAVANLNGAIAAKSDVIKAGLKQGGDPSFKTAKLRSYVAKFQTSPERQILLAGDPAAKKAYDGVLDTFMSVVNKYPKTVSGLLDARKEFDQIAERGMKGVFDGGTVSARKQAILDIRRQANNYIESQIPTGDAMKAVLRQQNMLFEARDNIAEKVAKNVGFSKPAQFFKAHPTATKALKVTGKTALGVAGLEGIRSLLP